MNLSEKSEEFVESKRASTPRARPSSFWLYHSPSGWVLKRLLEAQPEVWRELATTALDCLDATYDNCVKIRDEVWSGARVRGNERGFSLNVILDKSCSEPDYTCLDGKRATHPEISYYIGHKRRKTVAFGRLHPFLVEKVGENARASKDIMWLISFAVFVANLRGRLVKLLERIGVVEG